MESPASPIDLTYIYKLSIVKIKSIGSSNTGNNQTPAIRKDTNTLRKLVLINTFIERKMASYEEILLAKRNSANMNIGCGKIVNNIGIGGKGVRVKFVNVNRPNAIVNGVYSNPAATVSSNDLGDHESPANNEGEYERPVSPPPPYSPPYSPPSSPVYQHLQDTESSPTNNNLPPQKQQRARPNNNNYNRKQNYQRFQKQQQYYQHSQKRQQHYRQPQQEYPLKNDFGQILIPVQLHRNTFRPVEQTHYQQYHPSQGGYFNQPQAPQKAVQRILIPLHASPKQDFQFSDIPPPRYAPALSPSNQFHFVKLVRRPQLVDNGYY